jgi:hypothetical protein
MTFGELHPQKPKPIPEKIDRRQLEIAFRHLEDIGFIKLRHEVKEVLRALAAENFLDPCTLLNTVVYNAGPEVGANGKALFWVEKTPRHIFFLEEIFKHFPTARVICIYRNPGDIAYSAFNNFGYPLLAGLKDAQESYAAFESFRQKHPERQRQLFAIEYEDLRANPQKIAEVFHFLALSLEETLKIQELSRKAFQAIYGNTLMNQVQPQMRGQPQVLSTSALQRGKQYLALLAPLRQRQFGKFFSETRGLSGGCLDLGFWKFCLVQVFLYSLFEAKIFIKTSMILLFRSFKGWSYPVRNRDSKI